MDTTETYIKMCEKAEKIQEEWLPQVGDVFAHKHDKEKRVVERNPIYEAGCGHGIAGEGDLLPLAVNWSDRQDRYVWLPRQDQLQEMMGLSDRQLMKRFRDFLEWITGTPQAKYPGGVYNNLSMPYGIFLPSFEQLWLAFVMKEKYGKVWNGEDWIKEE